MISGGGWEKHSVWDRSARLRELYRRRCRLEEEEMTAHAQAAELLAPYVGPGDTLLDAGCGSGYFFHSLRTRGIPVAYHGIDASAALIALGREELSAYGLRPERLQVLRIEDLDGEADHVVCINVLTNVDNYHRPLERLLETARTTVILRESAKEEGEYRYVPDRYLDPGVELNVHVNAYPVSDLVAFIESHGFAVRYVEDRHTGGRPELVIDYPHYWKFFVAERR